MNGAHDKVYLDLAARHALRGTGWVEPNPIVGCVIVREEDGGREEVLGIGHHRRWGGPHAEVEALADCARRGQNVAGATMYVTLEPCNHHGKQPPCVDAIIASRIGRVVMARRDPNPAAAGGVERLAAVGIKSRVSTASDRAIRLSDPFVKRVTTGMPWVIAKWAQTIDGRIAARSGDSKWISNERSRRRVHELRARVDAILTGIGTVLTDDPQLTARGVAVRRVARRVVIDPRLGMPVGSALLSDAAPVMVLTTSDGLAVASGVAEELRARGATVLAAQTVQGSASEIDLEGMLKHLWKEHGVATVLVESGSGLLERMLARGLVDELLVFVGPMLLRDGGAPSVANNVVSERIADADRFRLLDVRRVGDDVQLVYRAASAGAHRT